MRCENPASPSSPMTRSTIGWVCQAPKNTPILPSGGSARQ